MPPDEWTPEAIRDRLRRDAVKGREASAQVFFAPEVDGGDLNDVARKAVEEAAARVGRAAKVTVGKVRPLAKSAAVAGDAEIIAEMCHLPSVTAVLPSSIDDIHPKPLNRREVE